jgi:hypothetical protein
MIASKGKNSGQKSVHRWESNLELRTYQLAILSYANDEDMGIYFNPISIPNSRYRMQSSMYLLIIMAADSLYKLGTATETSSIPLNTHYETHAYKA